LRYEIHFLIRYIFSYDTYSIRYMFSYAYVFSYAYKTYRADESFNCSSPTSQGESLWTNPVLKCAAVSCSVLQCVAECGSVWRCVAMCCSVLQCAAVCCSAGKAMRCSVLQCENQGAQASLARELSSAHLCDINL